ncbi:protein-disulfide reductase DsbD family protein [Sphingomicrobium marinum]|uniref:protein-disulfide reductase DsbD family protein n=1 Tax=Sphingomicrobium marinum TaxID=1227950 RepID=UPI00223E9A0C|nr:thioredoxin family protein [Sphingomicrobium marinum]
MILRLFLMLVALFAALPAAAQTTNIVPRLEAEGPAPAGGGSVELAIVFETSPGWHGYWLNPGEAGLPLNIEWDLPEGAEIGELRFPTPTKLEAFGLVNYVYKDDHAVLTTLTLPKIDSGTVPIRGTGTWLACTDKICVPEKGSFSVVIPVGEGADHSDDFDRYRRALPRPIAGAATYQVEGQRLSIAIPLPATITVTEPEFFVGQDGVIDYAAPQSFRRKGDQLIADLQVRDPAKTDFGSVGGVITLGPGQALSFTASLGSVPSGGDSIGTFAISAIAIALGGALLGGLLLNLMPCVFPVLAMKAVHLARAGGSAKEARRDALGYTVGAVAGTASLGALLLLIRAGGSAAGWAFQLQDPRTIFLLLLLATAITANLAGLFRLPALGGNLETSGSIGTGALAAFVATPCAGPFLGAALGTALVLPTAAAIGVFAMLGLGLALPFILIAFVPALREKLPRPGPWMIKLQRGLAIPMGLSALAALWLLWRLVGDIALVAGIAAMISLAFFLWLGSRRRGLGWVALAVGIGLVVAGAVYLPDRPSTEAAVPDFAEPWSEDAVAAARAQGRPVFVYFTADWCLTCKVNERAAIKRQATLDAFGEADVAVFVGDWTDGDPEITRFLEAMQRAAVPIYLWYAPGEDVEELPQVITQDMLVERAQSSAR